MPNDTYSFGDGYQIAVDPPVLRKDKFAIKIRPTALTALVYLFKNRAQAVHVNELRAILNQISEDRIRGLISEIYTAFGGIEKGEQIIWNDGHSHYRFVAIVSAVPDSSGDASVSIVEPTTPRWMTEFLKIYGSSRTLFEDTGKLPRDSLDSAASAARQFATPDNTAAFCNQYYSGTENRFGLRRYSVTVNGNLLNTSIYTQSELIGLGNDPLKSSMIWIADEPPASLFVSRFTPIAKPYAERIAVQSKDQVRLWNDPSFRLIDLETLENPVRFSEVPFFSYRFLYGLLDDELREALIRCQGNVDVLIQAKNDLPLRVALLPDLTALGDLHNRNCCGGLGVLLALKRRAGDYLMPLQIRSREVSDGRELLALIPKAFHQPSTGDIDEANIYWTVLRELAEEVFRKDEKIHLSNHMSREQIFSYPELKWFMDHRDAWRCEIVAVGLNGINGNYDFGVLMIVDDVDYYPQFINQFFKNWEAAKIKWVSSTDTRELQRLLIEECWANESLFHFAEALRRLKELDPTWVNLPDMGSHLV